ncbi:MAG: class I SAM-dependent methyltransferase, partial [Acidimicrobiales bacterium]
MQRLYASVDGGSRRRLMSRHLSGEGIELGPGHHPLAAPDGAKVRYVDRWSAADAAVLFPEVADGFIDPDVLVDFNAEGLAPIDDASQDFVIASHVLEHLANPLRMLCEIHRVLRPGGVALILLPDRTRVKGDKLRPATPLEHVVGEYDAGVTEIAPAHIFEVLAASGEQIPDERSERDALVELHRTRSV